MKHDVKVPEVGESITEVVVAQWLKKNGEQVEADDLICEIESDKASFEIPADHAGKLKILSEEGATVSVGDSIAQIDTDSKEEGEAVSEEQPSTESPKEPQEKNTEDAEQKETPVSSDKKKFESKAPSQKETVHQIKIPEVGESVTEVTLAQWLKKDGEHVKADDLLCEIESDKASFEIPADHAGTLRQKASEGESLSINDVIAEIVADGSMAERAEKEALEPSEPQDKEEAKEPAPERDGQKPKVSPVAANILSEAGLSPEELTGTGPGGRITKEDATKAVAEAKGNGKRTEETKETFEKKTQVGEEKKPSKEEPAPQLAVEGKRTERRERLSTLRKTISKRLVAAKNETAMLTTFNEVDMSAIMEIRRKYKDIFKEKHDIGLGFMSFFTRAVCLAIEEWPAVNAIIDSDHIVYYEYCDVSIAVSSPKGLVAPVIRNADKLSLAEIERQVQELADKARKGKLTIEEMTGGTFTITNGGVFGSMMSTPILNAPQSAILGMHRIMERPVVIEGDIVIRPMMYVAVSYDHRIIDGRESVSFLVRVKELLEDPTRMLLEV